MSASIPSLTDALTDLEPRAAMRLAGAKQSAKHYSRGMGEKDAAETLKNELGFASVPQVRLAPLLAVLGAARATIPVPWRQTHEQRVADLLAAGNRLLERARRAEAENRDLMAQIDALNAEIRYPSI